MNHEFDFSITKTLDATPARVWHALTSPSEVKQWMFNTDVSSTWEKGDELVYRGTWNGKPYEDHGIILEVTQNKLLKTSYFSPLSGKEDIPDNYNIITYTLASTQSGTTITIMQENCQSKEEADYMTNNWNETLAALATFLASNK